MPDNVDDASIRLVLDALSDGGPIGVSKASLRAALERAAAADDPARLPVTDAERRNWNRALDKRLERCLYSLMKDGATIAHSRTAGTRGAWYILRNGPAWDEHISAETRLALKLAGLTLAHSGTDLWGAKLGLIEQLAGKHMSKWDRALFTQLEKSVKVYGGVTEPPREGEAVLGRLLKAFQDRRMVQLEYRKAGAANPASVRVAPYALTHDLFSGGAYLLAWNPRDGKPKQYRLNRIQAVTVLDEPCVIHRPEKMGRALDYQIGAWASGDPPFEVVARIWGASWISAVREAPPAFNDFTCAPEGGKALRVRWRANTEEGPLRWLLQFGACAEVLEPPALRLRLQEELQAALARYRPESER